MVVFLSGKTLARCIANKILLNLRSKVASTSKICNRFPHLVIYHLNDLKSSEIYVKQKIKFASKWNINLSVRKLDEFTGEEDIVESIRATNIDPDISSIIVQLPLANSFKLSAGNNILDCIDPAKDIDALSHLNKHQLSVGCLDSVLIPPTVYGVLSLIGVHHELAGNTIGVVGQGPTLGGPCSTILERMNNRVIRMDKNTPNIEQLCSTCDIVVAASGQPNHISSRFLKEKCGLIDGGAFDEVENVSKSSVCMDESALLEKLLWISPSPGGLGPLTVVWLFYNVYISFLRQQGVLTPTFDVIIRDLVSVVRACKADSFVI